MGIFIKIEILQHWHFSSAGHAPCCPEINQYPAVRPFADTSRVAVQVLQRKWNDVLRFFVLGIGQP